MHVATMIKAFIVVLVIGGVKMSHASDDKEELCEAAWIKASAQYINQEHADYEGLLHYWEGSSTQCEGSVAYESRKAFIYAFLDQPEKAKLVISKIKKKTKFDYLVELVSLQIEVKEKILGNNLDLNALKKIRGKYVEYINRYPQVSDGYAQLGGIQILLKEFPESLVSLIKAKELAIPQQMQAGLYRNLVIAYFENGKYKEAYDAAGVAISLQKYVTDDKFFMYSLAKTEASLGKYEEAQTALKVIASKVPNIKSDPDFIASVDYVFDKMKDQKSSGL